jgi:hypothetical protein
MNMATFQLKTNHEEMVELFNQLEAILEKINNFELKVYGYSLIEEAEPLSTQKP